MLQRIRGDEDIEDEFYKIRHSCEEAEMENEARSKSPEKTLSVTKGYNWEPYYQSLPSISLHPKDINFTTKVGGIT